MKKTLLLSLLITPVLAGWVLRFLSFPVSGFLAIAIGFAAVALLAYTHRYHRKQLPVSSMVEYCALGTLSALVYLVIL